MIGLTLIHYVIDVIYMKAFSMALNAIVDTFDLDDEEYKEFVIRANIICNTFRLVMFAICAYMEKVAGYTTSPIFIYVIAYDMVY